MAPRGTPWRRTRRKSASFHAYAGLSGLPDGTRYSATGDGFQRELVRSTLGEAFEEARVVPLWMIGAIGDAHGELADDINVGAGGGVIDRLVQVVRGRVIALGRPFARDFGLRGVLFVADLHRQRGNP